MLHSFFLLRFLEKSYARHLAMTECSPRACACAIELELERFATIASHRRVLARTLAQLSDEWKVKFRRTSKRRFDFVLVSQARV